MANDPPRAGDRLGRAAYLVGDVSVTDQENTQHSPVWGYHWVRSQGEFTTLKLGGLPEDDLVEVRVGLGAPPADNHLSPDDAPSGLSAHPELPVNAGSVFLEAHGRSRDGDMERPLTIQVGHDQLYRELSAQTALHLDPDDVLPPRFLTHGNRESIFAGLDLASTDA